MPKLHFISAKTHLLIKDVKRQKKNLPRKQKHATLSVYNQPKGDKLRNMPNHGGNRSYDLRNANQMLCQLRLHGQQGSGFNYDILEIRL